MRKVWINKSRKGIPGVYVEWYVAGRKKSKYFSPANKRYVRPFMARKFSELNSDCRQQGETIKVIWDDFTKEYVKNKEIELAPSSLAEIQRTIDTFKEICQPFSTDQVTQSLVNDFIKSRQGKVRPDTVNKDVRNLRALFSYGRQRNCIKSDFNVPKVKTEEKQKRILTDTEVKELLIACADSRQWWMLVLMAVCTGLRRSDLMKLKLKDIDIERKTISVIDKKTGKATNYKPLPDDIIPEIAKFIDTEIDTGQIKFFKINFTKKWYTIKKRAKLEDIEFHDLRRTWGSMQASRGVSAKVLQEGYNHSTIKTTMESYIMTENTEARDGVNKLNVKGWL